jgi:hypothetical protein
MMQALIIIATMLAAPCAVLAADVVGTITRRQMARQPEFRAALMANLRARPEWYPILLPEKYRSKPVRRPEPELAHAYGSAEPAAAP